MQKKRKILWICITSICVGIVLIGLVFKFAFQLKTVDVETQLSRRNNSKLEIGVKDKIKTYFDFGENVILMEFDEISQRIEKDLPYVKINQVIKSFPNVVRVYISERIPKYKVRDLENNNIWYILDEDFKILEKLTEDEEKDIDFENSVEIESLRITQNEGEFLTGKDDLKNNLNSIMTGIFGDTEDYSVAKSICVSDNLEKNDTNFYVTMKNKANLDEKGAVILIEGSSDLVKKSNAGMTTYLQKVVSEGLYPNVSSTVITIRFDGKNYTGLI